MGSGGHDQGPAFGGTRRSRQIAALAHRRGDEFAQQVAGFGQRFVARGALRRAPAEVGERDDVTAVLVALDLGGIVVGVGHRFVSPWFRDVAWGGA